MEEKYKAIGFFDSGVGGLSVLKEAIKIMPNENYIYFGDSKNAPYGIKDIEEVRKLTYEAVDFLLNKGAKALVIACNTATSAAVNNLRMVYPDLPIVGIEPAIKPAVTLNTNKKIIIMATQMTIKEKKFKILMQKYINKAQIVPMPCAGLVEFIESGNLNSLELEEYIKEKYKNYDKNNIGAVVLGCTHYPFVRKTISKVIGEDIPIIDGALGTCKELKRKLGLSQLLNDSKEEGQIKIYNSLEGDKIIETCNKLLTI